MLLGPITSGTVLAQAPPPAPSDYVIYDTQRREVVDLAEMAARLDDADVVFFGETHDDGLAHALEDSTYALLLGRRGDVTLSLEMFETDVQPVVDEYLAGLIDEERLGTDARVWANHREAYQPMVARARAAGQDVIAANAPQRYVRLVGRRGPDALDALPEASRRYLPPYPFRYVDTAYRARFFGLMGGMAGHGAAGGELPAGHPPIGEATGLSPFFAAQLLWDATMPTTSPRPSPAAVPPSITSPGASTRTTARAPSRSYAVCARACGRASSPWWRRTSARWTGAHPRVRRTGGRWVSVPTSSSCTRVHRGRWVGAHVEAPRCRRLAPHSRAPPTSR